MGRFMLFLALAVLFQPACAQEWPTFRGGLARTGASAAHSEADIRYFTAIWDFQTGGPVRSSPSVADINGDGVSEVVFGSDDGRVYALDYRGQLLWSFGAGGPVRSSPTLEDVDGDGLRDVAFGSDDGNLYVLDRWGRRIWNFSTGGPVRSSPAVAGLDKVPGNEVVFGSFDGKIYSLSPRGGLNWAYETAESISSSPAVYDVDGDREAEVVIGSGDNLVYVLKYPPYKLWSYLTDGDVESAPAVDRSGKVVVGSGDGKVYRLEITSKGTAQTRRVRKAGGWVSETISISGLAPLWNFSTAGPVVGGAAVGDMIGPGTYGVVAAGGNTLYFINSDGTKNDSYTFSKPVASSPALADLDGDNVTDAVFGCDDGGVYVIDHPGVRRFSYMTEGFVRSSPAVADLTGDGALEFVVGSDDGRVYAFGDAKRRDIGIGTGLFRQAMMAKDVGDYERTLKYLGEARSVFLRANHSEGEAQCERAAMSLDADRLLHGANVLFVAGNISSAEELMGEAASIYAAANDSKGSGASELLYMRIEAGKYVLEARYYLDRGESLNATAYLEAARLFYRSLNDTEGLALVDNLSASGGGDGKAQTYMDDGSKALVEGRLDTAMMLFGFAKLAYEMSGDSEAAGRAEALIAAATAAKGDAAYNISMRLFLARDYGNASKAAGDAEGYYRNASSERAASALELRYRALRLAEASRMYAEAQKYQAGAYFKRAAEYASSAAALYNSSGDYAGFRQSTRLYDRAREDDASSSNSGTPWLFAFIVSGFILLVVWLIKRGRDSLVQERNIWKPVEPGTFSRKPGGDALHGRPPSRAAPEDIPIPDDAGRPGLRRRIQLIPRKPSEGLAGEPGKAKQSEAENVGRRAETSGLGSLKAKAEALLGLRRQKHKVKLVPKSGVGGKDGDV
jgi:hypothetical protein